MTGFGQHVVIENASPQLDFAGIQHGGYAVAVGLMSDDPHCRRYRLDMLQQRRQQRGFQRIAHAEREAAALPLNVITAWEGLIDRVRLQAGQTVPVQGGAGHVVTALGWGTHALAPLSFKGASYSGIFTLLPLPTGEGRAHHGEILAKAAALADAGKLWRGSIPGSSPSARPRKRMKRSQARPRRARS